MTSRPTHRPAAALWIGAMAVATYGSVYPFDFQPRPLDSAALIELVAGSWSYFSRGNAVANVLLFAPIGFFGALAGGSGHRRWLWIMVVFGVALVLAVVLQVVQLFIPARVPNLQDVAWNLAGTAGGVFAAVLLRDTVRRVAIAGHRLHLAPLLLIGAWLSYRLIPFVPSLSFQNIRDSLKPLLLAPEITWLAVARSACAWLVVAQLLRLAGPGLALDRFLVLLIIGTIALEVLMVSNVVSANNVLGAGIAMLLWWLAISRLREPAVLVVLLLSAFVIAAGLAPFTFRDPPQPFHWLPFQGFLGGSMYVNAQVACQKVFFYGSLVLLLWQVRIGRAAGLLLAVVMIGAVEVAQRWIDGRTAELTDPLLVLMAGGMLWALQRNEGERPDDQYRRRLVREHAQ